MPEAYVRRQSALAPNQYSRPNANPIFVDSDDESLNFGTGASGTTTRQVVDRSAALLTPVAYAVDGAITVANGVAKLTKAGVGAYTLAAPTAAQEGFQLQIVNQTANAHVVTATGLLDDGVTGGSKNTATFGAFVGATLSLVAINLKWAVVSKNVVTIA